MPNLDVEGRYLKISSTVWPPVVRKLQMSLLSGMQAYLLPPISLQEGFVPHSRPARFPPNMTFGKGC
jgi:hypothetical protein